MGIKLNLTDVEVKNFDPLPAGWYEAKVTGGELKQTSGDGKLGKVPMINWEFTVTDPEEFANRKQWMNTVIHETTLFNLKALLLATGMSEDDMAGEIDFEIEDILGETVMIKVRQREWPKDSGDMRNEVSAVKAVGAEEPTKPGKTKGATKKQSVLP